MLITTLVIFGGLVIGILVAAPVGPVNILCIQRTLQRGFWGGLAAGFGAVLGDGILALTAAYGIKAISVSFNTYQQELKILGGLILITFGVRLFMKKPVMSEPVDELARLSKNAGAIPQSFFLTVTNPGAFLGVLFFVGALASKVGAFDAFNAFVLVLAIMVGSLSWWFSLSWLISTIRHRLNEDRLKTINQGAGTILVLCGLFLLGEFLFRIIWAI